MEEQAPSSAAFRDPEPFMVEAAGHSFGFYPGGPDRLERLIGWYDRWLAD